MKTAVHATCVDVLSGAILGEWVIQPDMGNTTESLPLLRFRVGEEDLPQGESNLSGYASELYKKGYDSFSEWSIGAWGASEPTPLGSEVVGGKQCMVISKNSEAIPVVSHLLTGVDLTSYESLLIEASASCPMAVSVELYCQNADYPNEVMETGPGELLHVDTKWRSFKLPLASFRVPDDARISGKDPFEMNLAQMLNILIYPASSGQGNLYLHSIEFFPSQGQE